MHADKLDEIDLKILSILQGQGRTKRNEIAEHVKLSIPSVSERLRKLEVNGIIRGYKALVNPDKIGLNVTAFIFLTVESPKFYDEIIQHAVANDEVLECHAITGDGSHLLKVHTETTSSLERLLSQIQSWPGVKNTHTDVVLSSQKQTTVLPLKQLSKST